MIVGLLGGNELQPATRDFDRALLAASGADSVCVVGAAARGGQAYEQALSNAARYFTDLGVTPVDAGLRKRGDASRPEVVDRLSSARLTYLLGGDPGHLLDSLLDTPAWQAVQAGLRDGAAVAGSSAGAMVLAGVVLLRSRNPRPQSRHGRPGLGLVPDTVVIPHFERFGPGWLEAARAQAPGMPVLGLDEATGVVWQGQGWDCHGPGAVTVWREGKQVPLEEFRIAPLVV